MTASQPEEQSLEQVLEQNAADFVYHGCLSYGVPHGADGQVRGVEEEVTVLRSYEVEAGSSGEDPDIRREAVSLSWSCYPF